VRYSSSFLHLAGVELPITRQDSGLARSCFFRAVLLRGEGLGGEALCARLFIVFGDVFPLLAGDSSALCSASGYPAPGPTALTFFLSVTPAAGTADFFESFFSPHLPLVFFRGEDSRLRKDLKLFLPPAFLRTSPSRDPALFTPPFFSYPFLPVLFFFLVEFHRRVAFPPTSVVRFFSPRPLQRLLVSPGRSLLSHLFYFFSRGCACLRDSGTFSGRFFFPFSTDAALRPLFTR